MSNKYSKLVVFDFCETIVSKQTANNFINYISSENKTKWSIFISKLEYFLTKTRFFAIVDRIYPKLNLSKKTNLFKIRGINEQDLKTYAKKYYKEFIVENYNQVIIDAMKMYLSQNDTLVVIASGGYNPYLEIFCKEFNIHHLFSSKIECKNLKVTGFNKGEDCMFEEKVKQLNAFIEINKLTFGNKIVYSDSVSDLPLFKWGDISHVISYNKSQNWPLKYNYNEIIITKL